MQAPAIPGRERTRLPSPDVLIPEVRRQTRRRRFWIAIVAILVVALAATAIAALAARGSHIVTPKTPGRAEPPSLRAGTIATVDRLGRGSSIWVVDMLSTSRGFAIAGAPGSKHSSFLVATRDGGQTWRIRSRLPYPITSDLYALPTLQFLNGRIGYTQSGIADGNTADRSVDVTTDGGLSWHPLIFAGYTVSAAGGDNVVASSINESYQIAGGVVSVLALQCTGSELLQGGVVCPTDLDQFKLGRTVPFSTARIPPIGEDSAVRYALSDRLLAAVSTRTAIVVEGDLEGWEPALITHNAGRTWATWPNPCASIRVAKLVMQLPIQELHLYSAHQWVLDCYQGGGMSQGSTVVSASANQGRTWQLLSEGSEGANAAGIPSVGTVGDNDQTIWESNNGRFMWSWNSTRGWLSESSDGGREWSLLGPVSSDSGGAPYADLSPLGRSGAILVALGKAIETTDGVRWHHVRLLAVN